MEYKLQMLSSDYQSKFSKVLTIHPRGSHHAMVFNRIVQCMTIILAPSLQKSSSKYDLQDVGLKNHSASPKILYNVTFNEPDIRYVKEFMTNKLPMSLQVVYY